MCESLTLRKLIWRRADAALDKVVTRVRRKMQATPKGEIWMEEPLRNVWEAYCVYTQIDPDFTMEERLLADECERFVAGATSSELDTLRG